MKTVILASALVAATFTAPAFAMDNPVSESRAKIERVLAAQKGIVTVPAKRQSHVMTLSVKDTMELDRYEAAKQRLFGDRSPPAGR